MEKLKRTSTTDFSYKTLCCIFFGTLCSWRAMSSFSSKGSNQNHSALLACWHVLGSTHYFTGLFSNSPAVHWDSSQIIIVFSEATAFGNIDTTIVIIRPWLKRSLLCPILINVTAHWNVYTSEWVIQILFKYCPTVTSRDILLLELRVSLVWPWCSKNAWMHCMVRGT